MGLAISVQQNYYVGYKYNGPPSNVLSPSGLDIHMLCTSAAAAMNRNPVLEGRQSIMEVEEQCSAGQTRACGVPGPAAAVRHQSVAGGNLNPEP